MKTAGKNQKKTYSHFAYRLGVCVLERATRACPTLIVSCNTANVRSDILIISFAVGYHMFCRSVVFCTRSPLACER